MTPDEPYANTHTPTALELSKVEPVFNTNVSIHPSFGPMLHELMAKFKQRQVTVIETLLRFTATNINWAEIVDFFETNFPQPAPPPPSRVRSGRRKAPPYLDRPDPTRKIKA